MTQPLLLTIAAIALLVGGIAIGFVIARSRGDRQSAERANRVQEEYDAYRNRVTEHFRETAGQFQAIGEQYRDLYRHLASGAESLCEKGGEAGRLEFRPPPELIHDTVGGSSPRAAQQEKPAFTQPREAVPEKTQDREARMTAAGEVPPGEPEAGTGETDQRVPGRPDPDATQEDGPRVTAAGELPAREPDAARTDDKGESTEGAKTGSAGPSGKETPAPADEQPKPAAKAAGGQS